VTTRTRFAGLAALLTVLALLLAACGSDNNSTDASASGASSDTTEAPADATACATGTITGAGSTFVQNIEQQWAKDFQAKCAGATLSYQGVGSGAGIQQFTAGTVDFGATDAVMKPDEEQAADAKGGQVLHIPWSAGGIAIEYNLDGVDELHLSPETLAGIFAGKITKWNDAALKADNPDAKLPSAGIQVVHRSDGSGTTNALTSYLDTVAKSVWTVGAGKDVPWPTGQGAKGSDGVTALVKQTPGSIGYAEVSFAEQNSLGIAKIKNAAGKFVAPTGEAVAAALAGVDVPADLKIKPDYAVADPAAYPLATPTWVVVYAKPADAAKGKLLKAFLGYAITTGQASADKLFYAPLPASIAEKAKAAVDSIQA
jgi:phosphate transport system substrate-binding protein